MCMQVQKLLLDVGFKEIEVYKDWSDDAGLYRHSIKPISLEQWNTIVGTEGYASAYVVARK